MNGTQRLFSIGALPSSHCLHSYFILISKSESHRSRLNAHTQPVTTTDNKRNKCNLTITRQCPYLYLLPLPVHRSSPLLGNLLYTRTTQNPLLPPKENPVPPADPPPGAGVAPNENPPPPCCAGCCAGAGAPANENAGGCACCAGGGAPPNENAPGPGCC